MTLLDAYALVAYLVDEPASPEVQAVLRERDSAITAVNLAEALDVACRVYAIAEAEARDVAAQLEASGVLAFVDCDAAMGMEAASLRLAHYDRRTRPLSIADCFLLAAARPGGRVATADPHVLEVAREEGLAVVPLPDSTGRRP